MSKTLALFDFDGTISRKDSLIDFLSYSFSTSKLIHSFMLASPYLVAYKLGYYPNDKAKEKLLTCFIQDMPVSELNRLGAQYAKTKLPQIIRAKAIEKLKWHQSLGHRVIVVTASIDAWLRPWCDEMHVELLATELVVKNNCVSGKILGDNCFGAIKVKRIRQHLDITDYDEIVAYGDSRGDKELLAFANKAYYQYFTD